MSPEEKIRELQSLVSRLEAERDAAQRSAESLAEYNEQLRKLMVEASGRRRDGGG